MSAAANALEGSFLLLDTLKKAATVLRDAGLRFALAGGAAYARSAALPMHDVDFVILEEDVDAAAEAFESSGIRVERPPEGWLIKAFDDVRALLDRAGEISAAAIPMPVLGATGLVISWLGAFSEHHADFAGTLTCVRPLREQADWARVRAESAGSAFATSFLVLLSELRVVTGEEG